MDLVSRRTFVKGLAAGGAVTAVSGWPQAASAQPGQPRSQDTLRGTAFDLAIGETLMNFTGSPKVALTINGSVPGPLLRWREGDTVTLRVEAGQPFLDLEKEAFIAERDQLGGAAPPAPGPRCGRPRSRSPTPGCKLRAPATLSSQGDRLAASSSRRPQLAETSAELRLEEAREAVQQAQANLGQGPGRPAQDHDLRPDHRPGDRAQRRGGRGGGLRHDEQPGLGDRHDRRPLGDPRRGGRRRDRDRLRRARPAGDASRSTPCPTREYHGQVVEIGSSGFTKPAQPDVTFFKVKILLDEPDADLRAGMSARAEIETAAHTGGRWWCRSRRWSSAKPLDDKGKPSRRTRTRSTWSSSIEDGKARPAAGQDRHLRRDARRDRLGRRAPASEVVTGPYRALRDLKDGDAVQVTTEAARTRRRETQTPTTAERRTRTLELMALIELRDIAQGLRHGRREGARPQRRRPRHRARRVRGDHGLLGQRQVDADEPARLPRHAERRHLPPQRHGGRDAERHGAGGDPQQGDRLRLPDLQPAGRAPTRCRTSSCR